MGAYLALSVYTNTRQCRVSLLRIIGGGGMDTPTYAWPNLLLTRLVLTPQRLATVLLLPRSSSEATTWTPSGEMTVHFSDIHRTVQAFFVRFVLG